MSAQRDSLLKLLEIQSKEGSSDGRLDAGASGAIAKALAAAGGAAVAAGVIGPQALPAVTSALQQVARLVSEALEVRLGEIMVSAWNKRAEIRKYGDTTKYPPGQRRLVQLYEHPITWTYAPTVQLLVAGTKAIELPLEVKLALKVDQAVLVIEGGRVRAIEPGEGKLEVTAKLGSFELCPRKTVDLGTLPGSLSFASDGIAIGSEPIPSSRVEPASGR